MYTTDMIDNTILQEIANTYCDKATRYREDKPYLCRFTAQIKMSSVNGAELSYYHRDGQLTIINDKPEWIIVRCMACAREFSVDRDQYIKKYTISIKLDDKKIKLFLNKEFKYA